MPIRPVIGSCADCQHYGWLRYRWLCGACESWNQDHRCGDCVGCDRRGVALSKQHCRGCWKQAAHLAGSFNTKALLSAASRFPHHQLALAGLRRVTPGLRKGRPVRPSRPDASRSAVAVPGQLVLFPIAASIRPRLPSKPPPITWRITTSNGQPLTLHAFWTAQAVDEYGRVHGWSRALRGWAWATVSDAVNCMPPGCPISQNDLRARGGQSAVLVEALAHLSC